MSDKQLATLYKKGVHIDEIAELAGTTRNAITNRLAIIRREGLIGYRSKKGRRRPTHQGLVNAAEKKSLVRRLRLDGLTNAEIAEAVDISAPRVSQIVSELVAAGELEPRVNRFQ